MPFPRRISIDKYVPAETAIRNAMQSVEAMTAHPLLTDAVVLLSQAKDKVADFVDSHCSRCNKPIDTTITADMTSGCYIVSARSGWSAYARPGEVYLCDCCMWNDPKYTAVYGKQNLEGCE